MYFGVSQNALRYGASLGYALSRLEWIWDSKFDFCQRIFEESKLDIISQLPANGISINDTSYRTFSQSILAHFMRNDTEIYSSILLGIALHRTTLLGSSSNPSHAAELLQLASSPLVSIPKSIVPDKNSLFSFILDNKELNLFDILDLLDCSSIGHTFGSNTPASCQVQSTATGKKPTLFLSYSQEDECIANVLEHKLLLLSGNGIDISRYTRVPYKHSFREFMDSIPDHNFVLCIVSDSYLKSQACMYEVGEIVKDHNFNQKLLFIIVRDRDRKYYPADSVFSPAQIYGGATERLAYTAYWKDKYSKLEERIADIDDSEATHEASLELREIGQIFRSDINVFLDYLSKYNGRCFDDLYITGFHEILQWLLPK